jgi:hypothetical protein
MWCFISALAQDLPFPCISSIQWIIHSWSFFCILCEFWFAFSPSDWSSSCWIAGRIFRCLTTYLEDSRWTFNTVLRMIHSSWSGYSGNGYELTGGERNQRAKLDPMCLHVAGQWSSVSGPHRLSWPEEPYQWDTVWCMILHVPNAPTKTDQALAKKSFHSWHKIQGQHVP